MNSPAKDKTPSKKKPLIISGIILCILVFIFSLIILNSTAFITIAAEYYIAGLIKGNCSINELTYSLDPMQVNVKGFSARSDDFEYRFDIPNLHADLAINGKTLHIHKIRIDKPTLKSSQPEKLKHIFPSKNRTVSESSIVQKIFAYLLFQDVRLETVDLGEGTITLSRKTDNIIIDNIKGSILKNGSVIISGNSLLELKAQGITLKAPSIIVKSEHLMTTDLPEYQAEIDADNIMIHTPSLYMDEISLQSDISFNISTMLLNFERIDLGIRKIKSKSQLNSESLDDIQIKTSLGLDLKSNKVWSENVSIINDAINIQASLDGFIAGSKIPGNKIKININNGSLSAESIFSFIAPALEFSDKLAISGPVSFKGNIDASLLEDKWNIDWDINSILDELNYVISLGNNNSLKGDLRGTVDIQGDLPNIEIGIKAAGSEALLNNGFLSIKPFTMNTSLTRYENSLLIQDFQSLINSATVDNINLKTIQVLIPTASLDLENRIFSTPDISISSPLLKEAHIAIKAGNEIDINIINGKLIPNKIPDNLISKYINKGHRVSLAGPVKFQGNIRATPKGSHWNFTNNLDFSLDNNDFSISSENRRIKGTLNGDINARGSIPGQGIFAHMKLSRLEYKDKNIDIFPSDLSLVIDGKYPEFNIKDFDIKIPSLQVKLNDNKHDIRDILVTSDRVWLDLQHKNLSIPELRIGTEGVKEFLLSIKGNPERFKMNAQISSGLINKGHAFGLIPESWKIKGDEAINIFAEKKKNLFTYTIGCSLNNLNIENPDSSIIGENVLIKATMDGRANLSNETVHANASIMINKGEFLFDRFYFDFKSTPFISSLNGNYKHTDKLFSFDTVDLSLSKILDIHTQGSVAGPFSKQALNISYNIPETPLKPIYESFIIEPYRADMPILERTIVNGNISSSGSFILNREGWSIKSNLKWQDGNFSLLSLSNSSPDSGQKDIEIRGLNLDLPMQYQSRPSTDENQQMKGKLTIKSIKAPIIEDSPLSFQISSLPNYLRIDIPDPIMIQGGAIKLDTVEIMDVLKPERKIISGLELDIQDISPYISRLFTKSIHGTLTGKLRPISIKNNNMTSSGGLKADIFNGKLTISNLAVNAALSPSPVFRMNLLWDDLNLREITRDTSFGEMTGIVHGRMNDIEIAYGQPQKFDLHLETKEAKGVPKRISVKAVNNIAEISGGSSPFIGLANIMTKVINDFPYSRLGVRATLENDSFRVSGIIKENGTEYLIKRGRFSGVDVVNQNPDNRISFKDMLKRIQRVSSSKSGPVFK